MMLLHESIKYVSEFQWTDATEGVLSSYNSVSEEQRNILTSQGNASFDWSNVFIINSADLRTLSRIRRCNFDGIIYISNFIGEVVGSDGFVMQSGLYDSCFGGKCFLSDSCRISTTSFVGNTFVGLGAGIINCGSITCRDFIQGSTEYLNDKLNIDVGPETGGRKVVTSVGVTFLTICKQLFRDTDLAGECNLQHSYQSRFTIIGDQSFLMGCDQVHNSLLGPRCKVSSSSLRDCTLCSVPSSPISISAGARLTHCILNEACSASNNCLVDHVYFCENSSIVDCARVAHSVLGPDSSVAGGECHHSLLGPFVGFHHQSLLIATIWPQGRGNIAYDAKVGANHTGRVSDQECWPGEGIFFGLGSAIKFPSNLLHSPYSIVASGTLLSPQRITYPFSLISSLDRPLSFRGSSIAPTACTVCPGWVILSNPYMIDRYLLIDGDKFLFMTLPSFS